MLGLPLIFLMSPPGRISRAGSALRNRCAGRPCASSPRADRLGWGGLRYGAPAMVRALVATACLVLSGCGIKGPPRPPLEVLREAPPAAAPDAGCCQEPR